MNKQQGVAVAGAALVTAFVVSAHAGTAQGVVPKQFHVQFGATGLIVDANVEDRIYGVDGRGVVGVAIDALKLGQKAELTVTQDSGPRGPHEPLLYALAPNETRSEALATIEARAAETANTTRRLTGGDVPFEVVPPGTTVTLDPGTDYILLCNIVPHFRAGMHATVNENGNHVNH